MKNQKAEVKRVKQLHLKSAKSLIHTERSEYDRNRRMIHYIDSKFPHKRSNFAVFGSGINVRMTESPLNFDTTMASVHVTDCFREFADTL